MHTPLAARRGVNRGVVNHDHDSATTAKKYFGLIVTDLPRQLDCKFVFVNQYRIFTPFSINKISG